MRALVVDDSEAMRKILVWAMGQAGISEVDQACDGCEAVEAAARTAYGLVTLDLNMPRMTGIEAVRRMRAAGHKMPVLMLTTEGEKAQLMEALKAGADSYVIKSYNPANLLAKIQEFVGRS